MTMPQPQNAPVPGPGAPHGHQPTMQQYPAHPVAPQQAPQAQQPLGYIQFHSQGNFWTTSYLPPRVTINGYPVNVTPYSTSMVPVPAGETFVEAHMWWLWGNYGSAGLRCQVQPGQTVPVFYAPPMAAWAPGRMGVEPQKQAGVAAYFIMLGAILVPIIAAFGVLFAVSMMR